MPIKAFIRTGILILSLLFSFQASTKPSLEKPQEVKKSLDLKTAKGSPVGKLYSFDYGFGFPQLTAVEIALLALPRLQVGLSYGILPGIQFSPKLNTDGFKTTLPDGNEYSLIPSITTTLSCISPFIRYFPAHNPFYFQFTYAMLHTKFGITSSLVDKDQSVVAGASLEGSLTLVQALPTISIGHLFISRFFFTNLALGATVIGSAYTQVQVQSSLPESLGGVQAANDVLNELEEDMDEQLSTATSEMRKTMVLIPSFWFSMGIIF